MEYLYAFLIGCGMGILTHAKRNGKVVKPHNKKRVFEYGFLLDMMFGGVASLAFVTITTPPTMGQLLLTAVLAGYGGEALVAKLEAARLRTLLDGHVQDVQQQLRNEFSTSPQSEKKTS